MDHRRLRPDYIQYSIWLYCIGHASYYCLLKCSTFIIDVSVCLVCTGPANQRFVLGVFWRCQTWCMLDVLDMLAVLSVTVLKRPFVRWGTFKGYPTHTPRLSPPTCPTQLFDLQTCAYQTHTQRFNDKRQVFSQTVISRQRLQLDLNSIFETVSRSQECMQRDPSSNFKTLHRKFITPTRIEFMFDSPRRSQHRPQRESKSTFDTSNSTSTWCIEHRRPQRYLNSIFGAVHRAPTTTARFSNSNLI